MGTLELTGEGAVQLRAFGATDTKTLLAPKSWPGFAGDCVYALQDHVVSALLGKRSFENTAADYLRVMEVEDAIYRSAHGRRRRSIAGSWRERQLCASS